MEPKEAYQWLLSHNKETAYIDSMGSLLGWDLRTFVPEKGHAHRAEQLSILAKLVHSQMTDPKIGEMLSKVEGTELVGDPLSVEAVNVREWRRDFDRAVKIPERLAVELARATAEGESVWERAKPKNDWSAFRPYLERIVDLKREEASALGIGNEAYDALLDEFEPGERAENIAPLFSRLRDALVDLLDKIQGSSKRPPSIEDQYPQALQQAFGRQVCEQIGYDLAAGRLDASAHPFTVGIGPGDTRITTRYSESDLSYALFSTIHEAGHALYDQGLPAEHWGTPMGRAVSLGIHESQSRTWENLVGRSMGFWRYFYPEAQMRFDILESISIEDFYFAINEVEKSLIRTEADEVTYNLHVLLRFEIELDLMRGRLGVGDLPEAWNEKMKAFLGVTPPDYSSGVMQDIHWSGGAIGYFPTYTLGNLYAAQFFAAAGRDLGDLEALFAQGDFTPFLHWLKEKIHSQGSRFRPRELVRHVTGEDLNPAYLIDYLAKKFGSLYGF